MRFPVKRIGATRLLAHWLRFVLPPIDRQLLARFLNEVRGELSKESQRQIDAILEITQDPNAEPDPNMLALLELLRMELTRAHEIGKLEN